MTRPRKNSPTAGHGATILRGASRHQKGAAGTPVIVVAGFNSSVDKLVYLDELLVGGVVRTRSVASYPGGKGAHVALTAGTMGSPVRLVGIADDYCHAFFETFLGRRGVIFDEVRVRGEVRTCLAIRDRQGNTTEILEPGPELDGNERLALTALFEMHAGGAKVAVMSGSLPLGLPATTYRDLVRASTRAGTRCVVDAAGDALRHAVDARPYLVKPNRDEASALLGRPIANIDDACAAARAIAAFGIEVVVLSLGPEGAVASFGGRLCQASVTLSSVDNTVGAGDCMVGGLAVALARGAAPEETLRLGIACGGAKALSKETGMLRKADVERLLPEVSFRWLG
jgi:tagatose 6-phosphate kinase